MPVVRKKTTTTYHTTQQHSWSEHTKKDDEEVERLARWIESRAHPKKVDTEIGTKEVVYDPGSAPAADEPAESQPSRSTPQRPGQEAKHSGGEAIHEESPHEKGRDMSAGEKRMLHSMVERIMKGLMEYQGSVQEDSRQT